jgi:hypothetical protein
MNPEKMALQELKKSLDFFRGGGRKSRRLIEGNRIVIKKQKA